MYKIFKTIYEIIVFALPLIIRIQHRVIKFILHLIKLLATLSINGYTFRSHS